MLLLRAEFFKFREIKRTNLVFNLPIGDVHLFTDALQVAVVDGGRRS